MVLFISKPKITLKIFHIKLVQCNCLSQSDFWKDFVIIVRPLNEQGLKSQVRTGFGMCSKDRGFLN